MLDPLQEKKNTTKKYQNLDIPIKFFSLHVQGETIRIGKKIQCLPYAGFLI